MNRNSKAIAIALVMVTIHWAVYVARGGNFCAPSEALLEAFVGSLFTLLFFWMVGWILLAPDKDREDMEEAGGMDSEAPFTAKDFAQVCRDNGADPYFDPYSFLAARMAGIPYEDFLNRVNQGDEACQELRQEMRERYFTGGYK